MDKKGRYFIKPRGRTPTYDDSKIKKLIQEGKKAKEIAAEIGCSLSCVYKTRNLNKDLVIQKPAGQFIRTPRVDYAKIEKLYIVDCLSDEKIAMAAGCGVRTVFKWRHNNGLPCQKVRFAVKNLTLFNRESYTPEAPLWQ